MFYGIQALNTVVRGTSDAVSQTNQSIAVFHSEVAALRDEVGRLALLNQALWEILQLRLGVTDEELLKLATEIDLRDGKADGKITSHPLRCPSCDRVSSSRHAKCLYCGQEFEGSLFGGLGS